MRGSDTIADDVPLLNTPSLVALALRAARDGGASAEICADRLEALFRQTGERPDVGRDEMVARCGKAVGWLRAAGLLEAGDGRWVLTPRGREALAAHPQGMDLADLAAFPEFAEHLRARDAAARPTGGEPAEATAYDQGFAARHEGVGFTDNPHDFGTADHQLWEKGWCEALDEEAGPGISPLTGTRRDAS
jgi:hypothetical protein